MKIVTVIPFQRGLIKEHLTYFTSKNVELGDIVTIPIRAKKILGMIVDIEDAEKNKTNIKDMNFNLRKILQIQKNFLIHKEFINTTFELSKYFIFSKNNTISFMLPSIIEKNYEELNKISEKNKIPEEDKKIKADKYILQSDFQNRINIYKNLIRESFKNKNSVFLSAPNEISLEKFYKELSLGIEKQTFLIHGGLNPNKQKLTALKILEQKEPLLIIGSIPFLALNKNDIKTIIIENESSASYKMMIRPFLDLTLFAEIFASKNNQKIIFADTLLSFNRLQNKKEYKELYPLSFDLDFKGEIKIQNKKNIENENTETVKRYKIFSDEIIKKISKYTENKKNVFIYTLRKGLATETICADCKTSILCDHCFAPVVLYSSANGTKRIYACNKCKTEKDPSLSCPKCASWNLLPLGIGTDTVYEELKSIFPDRKIYQIDKEKIKSKKEMLEILKKYEAEEGSILVGTELALFYINSKIPLSIIASFDSLWSIPNYKMSEKILQIINSITNKTKEEFIIQTKNINDYLLKSIENNNLFHFIRKDLEIRRELNYPPFKTFIKIKHLDKKEDRQKTKHFIENYLRDYNPDIFSAFIGKIKDHYITNILIRLEKENWYFNSKEKKISIDEKLYEKLIALPRDFIIQTDPEDII